MGCVVFWGGVVGMWFILLGMVGLKLVGLLLEVGLDLVEEGLVGWDLGGLTGLEVDSQHGTHELG